MPSDKLFKCKQVTEASSETGTMFKRIIAALLVTISATPAIAQYTFDPSQDVRRILPDGSVEEVFYSHSRWMSLEQAERERREKSRPLTRAEQHRRDSSCRLLTSGAKGSGTLIAKKKLKSGKTVGIIMSCAHMFDPAPWSQIKEAKIAAKFKQDGETRACQPLAIDWDNDILVLAAYVPDNNPVSPLAKDHNDFDGEHYLVGYGSDGRYQVHTGPLRGFTSASWNGGKNKNVPANMSDRFISSGKNQIYIDSMYSRPGDSGGGILNSRGELMGVFWGSGNTSVYGTYAGTIKKFLSDKLPENYRWTVDPNYSRPEPQQQPPPQKQTARTNPTPSPPPAPSSPTPASS